MIPCLYDSFETAYANNGIGKLSDCQSCLVTEKRNGSYELKMDYPSDGIHADELTEGNIILAKCSDRGQTQPFRIYKITTPLSGQLTVQARHISYQLNHVSVSPCTAVGSAAALTAIMQNATTDCPFVLQIDFVSEAKFKTNRPMSLRSCLGGAEGSMIDTYGGELEWDRYLVTLHHARGADHGVRIVYGKNLIDFKMERSIENVITGIHPYWVDSESNAVLELPEKIVTLEKRKEPFAKIAVHDFTDSFESKPTVDQLRSKAKSYLKNTTRIEPDIDITVDFTKLSQMPGYEDIAEAEDVSLCDTVHVYISKLGIEVSSKVTETVYDSILERYHSITLSNSLTSSRNYSLSTSLSDIRTEALQAAETANSAVLVASEQTIAAAKKMVAEQLASYRDELGRNFITQTDAAQAHSQTLNDAKEYADGKLEETVNGLSGQYQTTAGMEILYQQWLKDLSGTYATNTRVKNLEDGLSAYFTEDRLSEYLQNFVTSDVLQGFATTEQLSAYLLESAYAEQMQQLQGKIQELEQSINEMKEGGAGE